jgi:8-oxo-dGTP pyrophosphatase MutT (NUDIX family)
MTAFIDALDDYRRRHPEEAATVALFAELERDGGPGTYRRERLEGHFTASAWLVGADGRRALLTHHRKLDRWLQPGGHAEPGESAGELVALREAFEESGIAGLALHPAAPRPLDLDVHVFPARGSDPQHEHLDLRYLVVAPSGARFSPDLAELHELRWVAWRDTDSYGPDDGLRRALAKARALLDSEVTP